MIIRSIILRFFFTLSIMTSLFNIVNAQKKEIGFILGGVNVNGDVGDFKFLDITPSYNPINNNYVIPYSLGILYRYNLNPYSSLRINGMYSKVFNYDYNSNLKYKKFRNRSFVNNLLEFSILIEQAFRPINIRKNFYSSPYIFAGVGEVYYKAKKLYINGDINVHQLDKVEMNKKILFSNFNQKSSLVFPLGLGYKIRYNSDWILSFELGYRFTNTDDIDYNNPYISKKLKDKLDNADKCFIDTVNKHYFGDSSNNDNYFFTGINLTYNFGKSQDCYCEK